MHCERVVKCAYFSVLVEICPVFLFLTMLCTCIRECKFFWVYTQTRCRDTFCVLEPHIFMIRFVSKSHSEIDNRLLVKVFSLKICLIAYFFIYLNILLNLKKKLQISMKILLTCQLKLRIVYKNI